jgi:hypothetical protein
VTVAAAGEDVLDDPPLGKTSTLVGVISIGRAEVWIDATELLAMLTFTVDATANELARAKVSVTVVNAVILLVSVETARTRIRYPTVVYWFDYSYDIRRKMVNLRLGEGDTTPLQSMLGWPTCKSMQSINPVQLAVAASFLSMKQHRLQRFHFLRPMQWCLPQQRRCWLP